MTEPSPEPTDEKPAEPAWVFKPSAASTDEGDALALRAMRVFAFEYTGDLFWRVDDDIISVMVNCSDVFMWGSSDSEVITSANIDLLESTFAECEAKFGKYNAIYAGELFCARMRKMRPQGAWYAGVDPEWFDLFNACGPERETGFGNPMTPEVAIERRQARRAAAEKDRADKAAAAAGGNT